MLGIALCDSLNPADVNTETMDLNTNSNITILKSQRWIFFSISLNVYYKVLI